MLGIAALGMSLFPTFSTASAAFGQTGYFMSIMGQVSDGSGKPVDIIMVRCPLAADGLSTVDLDFYRFGEGSGTRLLGHATATLVQNDHQRTVIRSESPKIDISVDRSQSFAIAPLTFKVTGLVEWKDVVSIAPDVPLTSRELNPRFPARNDAVGPMLNPPISDPLIVCR